MPSARSRGTTSSRALARLAGGGAREIAPRPPEPVPNELRRGLILEETDGGYTRLGWRGTLSDPEREGLRGWTVIAALANAVDLLLRELDAAVLTEPRPLNDFFPEVPAELAAQLGIAATEVAWRGAADERQLDALRALAAGLPQTDPLAEALTRLAERLRTREIVIDIAVPRRPRTDEIPESLRPRLVIGCAVLRYHGVMTPEDAEALMAAATGAADPMAVAHLYAATLRAGTAGRRLSLRARRGSAFPAEPAAIQSEALPT
jgi:hypothetical protein